MPIPRLILPLSFSIAERWLGPLKELKGRAYPESEIAADGIILFGACPQKEKAGDDTDSGIDRRLHIGNVLDRQISVQHGIINHELFVDGEVEIIARRHPR